MSSESRRRARCAVAQCRPKMASGFGFSIAPSATISFAPHSPLNVAGIASSAGWKRNFTEPFTRSRCFASNSATPSATVVCTSCPHACITPTFCERYGVSFSSRIGSASMSARTATHLPGCPPLSSATTPCFGHAGLHLQPERAQTLRHQRGRARLLVGKLGMPVNVAPRLDEPREHLVDRLRKTASRAGSSPMAAVAHRRRSRRGFILATVWRPSRRRKSPAPPTSFAGNDSANHR